MEAVTRKLDFVLTGDTADLRAMSAQRATLRRQAEQDRQGLIERVAYTWFNRFTALRFIDAHGWHPFGARVLTGATAEDTQPELLRVVRSGQLPADLAAHTDPARLNRLLDGALPSANPQGEVYRHLVLAACRFYHALLPDIFEKLDDETELLLPDDLLTEHSVVHGFRTEIGDADCAEVEILGWLYQFYISERKDEVMARKIAVPTEDIPAVTQLFTPHWIVRYLVENSLGRLWLLNRPQSKLRARMPYYIEGEAETDFLKIGKPEEIKLVDPAAGSAHMLTYSFDLLYAIYEEEGYAPTEIPALILRHNLHGLEICPRAAQLAELALVFKAREKSRRFFQPEHLVRPHIIELREVRYDEGELSTYFKALGAQPSTFNPQLVTLLHQFEEAKNFGSLIQPCLTEAETRIVRSQISNCESSINGGDLMVAQTHFKVLRVLEQAESLTQRYHVVVANPPYMGVSAMNPALRGFIEKHWKAGRADTYATFIVRNLALVISRGFVAMITIPNWMFLKTFQTLRDLLLDGAHISSLVHCGRGVWGADFGSCAFVLRHELESNRPGTFRRLFRRQGEVQSNEELESHFFNTTGYPNYTACNSDFRKIAGNPIAYWLSPTAFAAFTFTKLADLADIRSGIGTSDNCRFLRCWFEVPMGGIKFGCNSIPEAIESKRKWFPYNKGGSYRRWFGNREQVVNWLNDGEEIKKAVISNPNDPDTTHWSRRIFNTDLFFRPSLTWNDIGVSWFSVRLNEVGFIHDAVGVGAYGIEPQSKALAVLSLLNSNVAKLFVEILCPTVHFKAGQMAAFPVIIPAEFPENLGLECIALARADWDNFETSWDYRDQALLRPGLKGATLGASWRNWEVQRTAAIRRMQELETENNRLFIAAYGLDGELQPEVPEEQITLARADVRKDTAAFLSYAAGCMMGRYSLDEPGLILANAGDTLREFLAKVGRQRDRLTFAPDEDGIIPVLDGEWFEDDIVARTRDFLRATFGEATLNENLRFIEESLGKDLRKYFLADFYKSHLQTYKKRPIYWLFRSPKGGFAALVYLHRMTRDTPNLVLNRYLRNYLVKLRARIEHLDHAQAVATTAKEKTAARKESDQLKKTLRECEDWERDVLLPLAQSRPALDLDDGVKVNYLKLGDALAPIPGLAAAEDE
jgi:hypothetical protein